MGISKSKPIKPTPPTPPPPSPPPHAKEYVSLNIEGRFYNIGAHSQNDKTMKLNIEPVEERKNISHTPNLTFSDQGVEYEIDVNNKQISIDVRPHISTEGFVIIDDTNQVGRAFGWWMSLVLLIVIGVLIHRRK